MDSERGAHAVGAESRGWVLDDALWQFVEWVPGEAGAFGGFTVGGFAEPVAAFEEQAGARFRARTVDVQCVHVPQVGRFDQYADFFFFFGIRAAACRTDSPASSSPEGRCDKPSNRGLGSRRCVRSTSLSRTSSTWTSIRWRSAIGAPSLADRRRADPRESMRMAAALAGRLRVG